MDKLLAKLTRYKGKSRKLRSFRYLFFGIVVLTVFNLGANLFNSYLAFTGKADQYELRQAQAEVTSNQQSIKILQDEAEVRVKTLLAATNARREIQIQTVNALTRNRSWTEQEKRIISNYWNDAWNEGIENPFPEYLDK